MTTDSPLRETLSTSMLFDFGEMGSLRLPTAPWWIPQRELPTGNVPPTITFRETAAGPERLLISVTPISKETARPTPRELWRLLQEVFEQLRPQVVETEVRPHALATSEGSGCFFTTTDRLPKPGEFLYMTSGMVPAGDLLLSFTILTNPDEAMVFAQALGTIRSAIHLREGTKLVDREGPPATVDEAITAFMAIDLNSEAGLFVQDHPELLEDLPLLILQKVATETNSMRLHDSSDAARCALTLARMMGITGAVWAPGEILAFPGEVFGVLRASLAMEGPDRPQTLIRTFENELQKAGAAATLRPWAILHLVIAQELLELGNSRAEFTETAIKHMEIARKACADPSDCFIRAAVSLQLSIAYRDRAVGERASNMETAIGYAKSALESLDGSGFVVDWVTAKIRLGNAYGDRISGFRADNLENAILCFESALQLCPDQKSRNWAAIQNNLGSIYLKRILGGKYPNARKAIEYLQTALTGRDEASGAWAELHLNLGNAYQTLAPVDIEATEKAIQHFEQAAAVFLRQGGLVNWARVQHNLGDAYRDREIGDHDANIATAMDHFKKALTILTLSLPRDHRTTQSALGKLYLAAYQWEEASASFHAAITADEVLVSTTITLAGSQAEFGEIGYVYSDASYCLLRLGRYADAFLTLEKGKARFLAQTIHRSPTSEVQSEANATASADLRDATQLLEIKLKQLDILEAHIDTLDEQNLRLARDTRDELPSLIEHVQQARGAQSPVDPMPRIEDLLGAIPADGALVAPVITQAGTAVFIMKGGSHEIASENIVWIDGFTNDDLIRILLGTSGVGQPDGWLNAYFQHKKERTNWSRVIVNIGSILWRELFEPIHARLTTIGLRREAPLVLLPSAGLSILPLHAAWRNVEGRRAYAAEDYTISCCPSASLLASSNVKLRSRAAVQVNLPKSILVVADPTGDLPFAAIEGKAIAAECDPEQTQLLLGTRASWSAVSREFDRRAYIHFACHGVYDPTYPARSFLALAPAQEYKNATGNLRLLELFDAWDTDAARLVVLSGCETAITDVMDAPSEYMGLATGWLRAGVLGVIGSLWVVDDLCTMLLMERFYQLHLGTGSPSNALAAVAPDSALRAAQLWLKDLSNEGVCERLAALQRLPGLSPAELDWIAARRQEFSSQPAAGQPFSEPYWWAGFTYAGA